MQRPLTTLALALLGLPLLLVVAGQFGLLAGTRPSDLGVHDGRLKPAPDTPNAVSSEARAGYHAIAPLAFQGDPAAAFARVARLVRETPGVAVIVERPDYLHAECSTRWLRFVDDLELLLDPAAGVIHVRSASRIGHGDLGANRARVEALRARFAQAD